MVTSSVPAASIICSRTADEIVVLLPVVTVFVTVALAETISPSPSFFTVTVVLVVFEDSAMTVFSVTESSLPSASVFVVVVTTTSFPLLFVPVSVFVTVSSFVSSGLESDSVGGSKVQPQELPPPVFSFFGMASV